MVVNTDNVTLKLTLKMEVKNRTFLIFGLGTFSSLVLPNSHW